MIKYTDDMIKKAKMLFPEDSPLLEMMRAGDPKVVDMIYSRIGFYLDEDDIIKAFRNKKEQRILDMAKKVKAIRELYQQVLAHVDKMEIMKAQNNDYSDCI